MRRQVLNREACENGGGQVCNGRSWLLSRRRVTWPLRRFASSVAWRCRWRRRFKQRAVQGEVAGFVELRAGDGELCDGSEGHDGRLEVHLGSATLLAPLSSLRQVVAALMSEADGRC